MTSVGFINAEKMPLIQSTRQQLRISYFGQVRLAAYCDVDVEHGLLKATWYDIEDLEWLSSLSTSAYSVAGN